jgi:hypothetical protein
MRKFQNGNFGNLDTGCLITSIFPNWLNEPFIFAPTLCALTKPGNSGDQQAALNAGGSRVGSAPINSYYSGSWVVLATLTMNGDVAKSANLVNGLSNPVNQPNPVPVPTNPPPQPNPVPINPVPTNRPPQLNPVPTNPPPVASGCQRRKVFGRDSFDPQFSGSWSWGNYQLADRRKSYLGTFSLSLELSNWNGLQIACSANCITSTYVGVEFYVATNGGTSNPRFRVRMRSSNSEVGVNSIQTATPTWTKKTVLFQNLAPGIRDFNVIQFQDDTGSSGQIAFFDEIYLITASCI